ncbi:hypothetical protein [Pseudomonas sp. PWP3-1b2]|uniref:hypothetical protein n=1 Tax=Pseudomonas sp. PWP3-1b2 TaxID=2804656 RepID=UPI003CEC3777
MANTSADNTLHTNVAAGVAKTATVGLSVTPTLPPLIIDNVLPDGLIPTRFLFMDLPVKIEAPWTFLPQAGESDWITFIWHVQGSVAFELEPIELPGPIVAGQFPYTVNIPQDYFLNNGVVNVSYRINNIDKDSAVFEQSSPRKIIIDRAAPGAGGVLKAARFLVDPITPLNLISSPFAEVEVPGDYLDRKTGDTLLGYLSGSDSVPTRAPQFEQSFTALSGPMVMRIPVAVLEKLAGSKEIHFFYRVRDRAGNTSAQYSEVTSAGLALPAPVSNLSAPQVPAFDSDLIVKRDDARLIVSVRVQHYDNWLAGDQCVVQWGSKKLAPVSVTALPLTVPVDWLTLIANGSDRQRVNNVPVRYFILRAGDAVGPGVSSPAKYVDVDNTIFGQENPLAPALLNQLLPLVNIHGAVSPVPNRLDSRDADQPVRATIALPDNPKPGEQLLLFRPGQTKAVATYTVKDADVGGAVVEFDNRIPWAVIAASGNNATTLVNYQTDNRVNQQLSRDQVVSVSLAPPIKFTLPTFPDSSQNIRSFLNCETSPPVWLGIRVTVNPAPQVLLAGDEVVLSYQGFLNYPDRNPLPSTAQTFSYTWKGSDTTYTFLVTDYENLIRPLSVNAGASAKYSVLRNGILIGTSGIRYVQIDRKYPGSGNFCGPNGIGPK